MGLVECALFRVCKMLHYSESHDVQREVLTVADGLYLCLYLIVVCLCLRPYGVKGNNCVSAGDFCEKPALLPQLISVQASCPLSDLPVDGDLLRDQLRVAEVRLREHRRVKPVALFVVGEFKDLPEGVLKCVVIRC